MQLPEETKIFLVEGYELLESVESMLLLFEKQPADSKSLHSLFRSLHTIKGNAGFLGFSNLEKLCHRAESILDRARSGTISLDTKLAGVLLSSVDLIRGLFRAIESEGADRSVPVDTTLQELGKWLET